MQRSGKEMAQRGGKYVRYCPICARLSHFPFPENLTILGINLSCNTIKTVTTPILISHTSAKDKQAIRIRSRLNNVEFRCYARLGVCRMQAM
jgi:hypothetical protein